MLYYKAQIYCLIIIAIVLCVCWLGVPDVILLDYEMPMCDGKMTLQMIRELEEAKDIPVVFLTGVSEKEHIKAVLGLHPAGYLLKPASAEVIFETLNKILGEH